MPKNYKMIIKMLSKRMKNLKNKLPKLSNKYNLSYFRLPKGKKNDQLLSKFINISFIEEDNLCYNTLFI
jgi:hypothetical protein